VIIGGREARRRYGERTLPIRAERHQPDQSRITFGLPVSAYHRHDDPEFAKAQGAADERTSTLRLQRDEAAAFNPGLPEQRALFECTDHAGIHHKILPCTEALGQRNA
jgi:hypothetical protein